ncbi:PAS domain-containing protein [Rubrivirga sp. S365]|uniref:Oxygen sensor histidine kinase NreB n=1 Tax=Rubrivirga litoralis TaxID=3075598 RepID=A0ABU3BR32_9BACT|nr:MULTISPECIES: PAS domain-containing protein [unclassified Rubrivirga]MDT0631733.1 PAS domain-containing protein [Rubrivirga sp. F394]MDT7856103.1 PAS domain-containing protein [Rubrivirga sp. S365]
MMSRRPALSGLAGRSEPDRLAAWLDESDAFQFLSRTLGDVLVVLDPDERVVYAGTGADALFGSGTLRGCPVRSVLAGGGSLPPSLTASGVWEVQLADGRWVSLSASGLGGVEVDGLGPLDGYALLLAREIGEERVARDRLDLFRRALDATNNLVVVSDATQDDLPITFVNQHFLDVTGYEREEVLGRNCRFLQDRPDGTRDGDQDGVRHLRQSVSAGEAVHVLVRNYTKGGRMFWNDLFVTPVHDAAGRLTHYVGVQNDVTDRVKVEAERDARGRLLGAFFEGAPWLMGVVEVGEGGALAYRRVNRELAAAYGAQPADLAGRPLAALGHGEAERAAWQRAVRACLDGGGPAQLDAVWPPGADPDAIGARHLRITLTPVDDGTAAVVIEDVTEFDRLVAAQAERTAALEQAADAVVITDGRLDSPGPFIHYVNRAFEEMTGWTRAEVVGRSPRIMQGAMTDRAELDRMRRALGAGRPYRGELVNERKDGTPYLVEVDIAPLRDAAGAVTGYVSTQRDVTERRRLEGEVLSAAAQAQEDVARDLHDGLGQVLSGTAYHLHGLAESLAAEGSAFAAEAQRAADLVQNAQRQARSLAHGLSPVAVGVDGLAAALVRLTRDVAETYDVACQFVSSGAPAVRPVEAAGDLYRIAQEAVANAVRHGRPSSVVVRLDPSHGGDGDGRALLAIEDDGAGIPEANLDGADHDGAGGLGLRTMRYRARRVGGTFDVFRRPGGGTAVHVRFPTAAGAALADPPQPA